MLEKCRQGSADPDMTLFWQAVPAESALAPISSSAGQGVPLLPHLLPAQSPVLLSAGLPSLQEPFPQHLGLLLFSVLCSSFSEGSELFYPCAFSSEVAQNRSTHCCAPQGKSGSSIYRAMAALCCFFTCTKQRAGLGLKL